jgi:hypothetical protein
MAEPGATKLNGKKQQENPETADRSAVTNNESRKTGRKARNAKRETDNE